MQKNKKLIFITLLISQAVFWLILSWPTLAAYQIEVGIPGTPLQKGASVSDPGAYIQYFFIFGLTLAGFLAVAAIAYGGILYMLGGSVTSVEKAKTAIVSALSGLALLLLSYLLLATIDPTLVNLSPLKPPTANIPKTQQPQTGPVSCNSQTQVWSTAYGSCVNKPTQSAQQCYSSPAYCLAHEAECAEGGGCPTGYVWSQSGGACACVKRCPSSILPYYNPATKNCERQP